MRTCVLEVAGRRYTLEVAAARAAQKRGLSGRAALAKDTGMLFVFTDDAARSIVMRDMRFGIDILWLDAGKRIVHIEEYISPETYPAQRFRPEVPAHYVIELAAGEATVAGLTLGQELAF